MAQNITKYQSLTTDQLDQCQQHYEDAINQIATLKLPHEDVHKTAWESHKRAREITELQAALSDAQLAVFEERKEVLRLKAENDELRGEYHSPFLKLVVSSTGDFRIYLPGTCHCTRCGVQGDVPLGCVLTHHSPFL